MAAEIDYLLIGHITADIVPGGRALGGTVSYSARTAQAFDLRVGALTSAAANDPLLDEVKQYAQVISIPAEQTTTYENIYQNNVRTQYLRGLAAPLDLAYLPEGWKSAPLVHLAPLTGEISPEMVYAFPGSTVMLTLQGWLRQAEADGRVRFKHWLDPEILRALDLVVLSEEDISEAPELEAEFARSARQLVITRAYNGGTFYRDGVPHHYDAIEVEAIHPTGAGDIFATSLLASWYMLNSDMDAAVRAAAVLAGNSVTREALEGAPTQEEVRAAFQQVKST